MSTTRDVQGIAQVEHYLRDLHRRIVAGLTALDGQAFIHDHWERPEGGGGISCILEDGSLFERAGVGFSCVRGEHLPPSATVRRPELTDRPWQAMGVSLVLHPRNPHVPTVHMNVRLFVASWRATGTHEPDAGPVWWFGGGMDLTPYYAVEEDVVAFHRACRDALAPFGPDYHPRYKKWCDEYFHLRHRNEARGVGGIFFDDLNELGFEASFSLMRSVGESFLPTYAAIVNRRRTRPYGAQEREFQAIRRGRYAEFNLVWDRGTLFGLQSGGRTESILMSMPPEVAWRYDWRPEPGSPEERLTDYFLVPRDWV